MKGGKERKQMEKEERWEKIETKSFIQMKSNMMTLKNDTRMTTPVKWG